MSTALYRRYRPETFSDVIGQEHVTEPLMAALAADRITHAYLFSGPRGCGKTTSARILARCLNCTQGPTADPCGQCDSCVDLARGGPGSLDVVEIDAASHNGVDDARELRERAAFAPARDRYKIFILDEAHMVTTQGFNALLKLVEEPPPHIKFVFATTEPEKVIGTIRSRTHHYPFRLVAPEKLTEYLQSLAQAEGMNVAGGVLPLVVRAGGGSVRDSLSVLDQLIAGSADGELTYERAVALLGFTHSALLDDAVDALAARDGLSLFRVVDRVIESGHAPRRFVEDLLERLRDLIVVRAAGDEAASVLRSVPADQLDRMRTQAQHMGAGALSRTADLVNEGLTEMTGATSPRLQLELLCARLLLPAADDGVDGFAARLDRVEATLAGAPAPGAPAPAPGRSKEPARSVAAERPAAGAPPAPGSPDRAEPAGRPESPVRAGAQSPVGSPARETSAPGPQTPDATADRATSAAGRQADARASSESGGAQPGESAEDGGAARGAGTAQDADTGHGAGATFGPGAHPGRLQDAGPGQGPGVRQGAGAAPGAPAAEPAPSGNPAAAVEAGAMTTDQVRRRWPEVLETLARLKRTTWALVSQDAQVMDLSATTLALGFSTSGLATAFRSGPHADLVAQALRETLGVDVRIEPVLNDGSAGAASAGPARAGGSGPVTPSPAAGSAPAAPAPTGGGTGPADSPPPADGTGPADSPAPEPDQAPRHAPEPPGSGPGAEEAPAGGDSAGSADSATQTSALADNRASTTATAPGDSDAAPERQGAAAPGTPAQDEPAAPSAGDGWADIPVRRPPQDPPPAATNQQAHSATAPADPSPTATTTEQADSAAAPSTASPSTPSSADAEGTTATEHSGSPTPPADSPAADSPATDPPATGNPATDAPAAATGAPPRGASTPAVEPEAPAAAAPQQDGDPPPWDSPAADPGGSGTDEALVAEPPRSHDAPAPVRRLGDELDEHSPDDPDLETSEVVGAPLVARLLGGTVIDEEIDDAGQVS